MLKFAIQCIHLFQLPNWPVWTRRSYGVVWRCPQYGRI